MNGPFRIAIDAMGGDNAPRVNVLGALQALQEARGLSIQLVGDKPLLKQELKAQNAGKSRRLSIVHAEEVISMEEPASSVVRKKKRSSIHVGMRLVKDGQADAFISAGNSGAVMGCALHILGRLPGVERPAIIIKFPTRTGFQILLDAGANVDCKTSHLVQFAEMGHLYAELVEAIENPRVALLANGSESHKGNELTREVDAFLKERGHLNYQGYIEGADLFENKADVVVCDGFVGNIVLKVGEGVADNLIQWFRREVKRDLIGLVGVLLLKRVLTKFKARFDYQPYGSAPLLGINGLVMISHGSSTELAIKNGILTAKRAVAEDFVSKIGSQMEEGAKQALVAKSKESPTT